MSNKTGRKRKDHVDSKTGKPVVGLTRRPDGRWRIIGTHTTFREPDEQKAIEKFHRLTGSEDEYRAQSINKIVYPYESKTHPIWRWFADQISLKPNWVAEATGLEWIAYGPTLKKPEPLPTFADLKKIYEDHADVEPEERRKVLAAWNDFTTNSGINGLSGIDPKLVITYRDTVYGRLVDGKPIKGKTQKQLFNRIRRVLTFAGSRAVAVDACARAVTVLKLLTPNSGTVSLDPQPIARAAFRKLLAVAEGDDRALLLVCLNAGLYLKEAVDLKWSDLKDGCLVAHRRKTGQCVRAAVLWDETITALAAVPKKGEQVFYGEDTGSPLTVSGAGKRYRKLRKAAELPATVKANNIRDGAATAAFKAGVRTEVVDVLLGHRSGIEDHYIKRNPEMVRPATDAVHAHYFGKDKPAEVPK